MSYKLEDIGVDISDEDMILALTMGLDNMYNSFIISLDSTPSDQLDVDHVISHMINEEVLCENIESQGVLVRTIGEVSAKGRVKVKKEENVVMVAAASGPISCWRCRKNGHVKAFCTEKPIRGQDTEGANMVMAIGINSDDDQSLYEMSDREN